MFIKRNVKVVKSMKKVSKGNFGYTLSHRKWQILKMSLYVAIALAVFLLGLIVTKTTKNLMSVVAIVGALPISKEAVGVIMSFRRKPMDEQLYKEISAKAGNLEQAYELLFTTADSMYPVEAAVIEGNDLICFSLDEACDKEKLQTHLYKLLNANDYKQKVQVFTDYKKFMDRVGDLERRTPQEIPYKQNPMYPDLNRNQLVKHTLLALSV